MRCPFCAADLDDNMLVCRACHRDTAIPERLRAERDDLIRKRDALRAELDRVTAKLKDNRRRFLRAGPAS